MISFKVRTEIAKALNGQLANFVKDRLPDGEYRMTLSRPVRIENGELVIPMYMFKADIEEAPDA